MPLEAQFNEYLEYDKDLFQAVNRDLNTWNLMNSTYSTHGLDEKPEIICERMLSNVRQWQTDFGRRFLQFVDSPIE